MSFYFILIGIINIALQNCVNGKQIQFGGIHPDLEPTLLKKEENVSFIKIGGSDQLNGTIRLIRETGFLWTNWNLTRTMYYINYNVIADIDNKIDNINVSNVGLYFNPASTYFNTDGWCKNYFQLPGSENEIQNYNEQQMAGINNLIQQKQKLTHFLELSRRDEANMTAAGQLLSSEMLLIGHRIVFSHQGKIFGCSSPILPTDLEYFHVNLYSKDEGKQQEMSKNGNIILLDGSHIQFVKMPASQNLRMLIQIVYLCDENIGTNMLIHWTWNQKNEKSFCGMKTVNLSTIISYNCSIQNSESINKNEMGNFCKLIPSNSSSKFPSICVATGIQDYELIVEPLQSICFWFDQLPNQMEKNFTQIEFEKKKICKPILRQ